MLESSFRNLVAPGRFPDQRFNSDVGAVQAGFQQASRSFNP
jgi:hypothetical protein